MQNLNKETVKNRGIYLLPNLFTTAGLFSGFYAVIASMNGHFEAAAIAIFVAMIFDGVDGRVARMTNTQSAFGAEYDSMADMVSFGVAPALIAYSWALADLGKVGWLAAFIYCAGAALRLARFNTQVGVADKRYFQGLASPAAAAIIAGAIWTGTYYEIEGQQVSILALLMTACAGLLMVSNFRYYSFKDYDWRGRVNFMVILALVGLFVVVSVQPATILFIVFSLYALSGPIYTIRTVKKLKVSHVVGDENDADITQETNAQETDTQETDTECEAKQTEQDSEDADKKQ
ncbi:CDP-diacylglycerol--serine O-phosphatidyltransferase [Shewanella sp. cp20]|uniref:CDP-diacylglycerol--serine O-phosphatidyltransferase n=1 Tax=Shewanella sp. cp20 TaxID=1521167 RepID=UPI0005A2551F|nr:CDP-diacylglycerol--serine O-phosphatidyltransferase [Shewanella sp. cp20]KIO38033.1 CDP-diacylglycerol--serine O-phosphatidyltransferase [Shewanella sp. cp20]